MTGTGGCGGNGSGVSVACMACAGGCGGNGKAAAGAIGKAPSFACGAIGKPPAFAGGAGGGGGAGGKAAFAFATGVWATSTLPSACAKDAALLAQVSVLLLEFKPKPYCSFIASAAILKAFLLRFLLICEFCLGSLSSELEEDEDELEDELCFENKFASIMIFLLFSRCLPVSFFAFLSFLPCLECFLAMMKTTDSPNESDLLVLHKSP